MIHWSLISFSIHSCSCYEVKLILSYRWFLDYIFCLWLLHWVSFSVLQAVIFWLYFSTFLIQKRKLRVRSREKTLVSFAVCYLWWHDNHQFWNRIPCWRVSHGIFMTFLHVYACVFILPEVPWSYSHPLELSGYLCGQRQLLAVELVFRVIKARSGWIICLDKSN